MVSKQAKQLEKEIKELEVFWLLYDINEYSYLLTYLLTYFNTLFPYISSLSIYLLNFLLLYLKDDISNIKTKKSGQIGVERNTLLNELKSKTQKLIQKQDKFESQYRKKIDEFKEIKTKIHNLFLNLKCNEDLTSFNQLMMENGINENNVKIFLAEIESRIKSMSNFFKIEKEERFEVRALISLKNVKLTHF